MKRGCMARGRRTAVGGKSIMAARIVAGVASGRGWVGWWALAGGRGGEASGTDGEVAEAVVRSIGAAPPGDGRPLGAGEAPTPSEEGTRLDEGTFIEAILRAMGERGKRRLAGGPVAGRAAGGVEGLEWAGMRGDGDDERDVIIVVACGRVGRRPQ